MLAKLSRTLFPGNVSWLLRSGAGLGGMRVVNMAVGLATTVLLARLLGAEGYGVYTFVLGWVFILGMPLQMGLPTLVMRQVAIYRAAGDSQRLRGIVRWSFGLLGLSAVLIGVVCGIVAVFLQATGRWPAIATPILVASAFVLLCTLALLSLCRAIVCGFENVVVGSFPDTVLRPALFLIAVAAAIPFLVRDAGTVMAMHALAALAATFMAWSIAARRLRQIKGAATDAAVFETRSWLSSLWPMTLISGAAMINSRLDIAMLGLITGPTSVAIYDVGAKVAGFMMITQALLNASISPRIARLYASGDRAQVQFVMVQACRLSFFASAILLIAIWLAGSQLIAALFGQDFEVAHTVALIVAVGFLFNTGVGAVAVLLNMSGHERITAKVVTTSAVMNAILNAILIPPYGASGAAFATTLTTLFVQSFLWWKASTLTGIRADIFASWRPGQHLSTAAGSVN